MILVVSPTRRAARGGVLPARSVLSTAAATGQPDICIYVFMIVFMYV